MKSAKSSLRKVVNQTLLAIPPASKVAQGQALQKMFLNSPFYLNAKRVGIYLHFPGEAPTDLILQDILRDGSSKVVFVPVIQKGGDLKMVRVYSMADFHTFVPNKWGIPEPNINEEIKRETLFESADPLDVLLCPGLAFDKFGGRLGRGKGHYDKFINTYKENFGKFPTTIGYGFQEQMLDHIPLEEHDRVMDHVLTPLDDLSQQTPQQSA